MVPCDNLPTLCVSFHPLLQKCSEQSSAKPDSESIKRIFHSSSSLAEDAGLLEAALALACMDVSGIQQVLFLRNRIHQWKNKNTAAFSLSLPNQNNLKLFNFRTYHPVSFEVLSGLNAKPSSRVLQSSVPQSNSPAHPTT